ncbi:MAG TPA: DUF1641 domain-containing protein [Polyangiales bacterium]|nr:DUF1641 domain-containing protein [Polyangiales bacterium]
MELSKSSDMTDITARLDRLERSVGKLIDVISQSTLVTRSETTPGSTPLVGADDRMSAALSRLADPEILSALMRIAGIAPQLEAAVKNTEPLAAAKLSQPPAAGRAAGTTAEGPLQELTRTLHKPEVIQALTRVTALAPQLEYAALGAAALPELIEEALAVARDKTADTHEGAPLELRLQALAQAGLRLSHPEFLEQLSDVLVRALPILDKLSTIDPKALEQCLSLLDLVSAPELQAPLAQLFENLPAFTEALLALPTDRNAVALLKAAGDAVSDVVKQGAPSVGVFGAMRALTDPQVGRAFGLAVGIARALGGKLDNPVKQLASGE